MIFCTMSSPPTKSAPASTFLRAFSTCLPDFFIRYLIRPRAPELLGFHDFQAHVARRTHHSAHRGLQIGGVEVDKLDLRNLFHLLLGDFADFVAVRLRGTLGNIGRALQEHGRWRRFQNKYESA